MKRKSRIQHRHRHQALRIGKGSDLASSGADGEFSKEKKKRGCSQFSESGLCRKKGEKEGGKGTDCVVWTKGRKRNENHFTLIKKISR